MSLRRAESSAGLFIFGGSEGGRKALTANSRRPAIAETAVHSFWGMHGGLFFLSMAQVYASFFWSAIVQGCNGFHGGAMGLL